MRAPTPSRRVLGRPTPGRLVMIAAATVCAFLAGCSATPLHDHIVKQTVLLRTGGSIYVHPDGNDANYGTREAPKRTIRAAIDMFAEDGLPGFVWVAEGTYEVDCAADTHLVMAEDVEVNGGCSSDFNDNDPAIYETVIRDTSSADVEEMYNCAVYFPAGVDDAPLIGCTVIGGSARESYAIVVDEGSSPAIHDCVIRGGNPDHETYDHAGSAGVLVTGGGPGLLGCTITGSTNPGASWSSGIVARGATDRFRVEESVVDGGLSTEDCIGIEMADDSAGYIGESTITVTSGTIAAGIRANDSGTYIVDNVITVGGPGFESAEGISVRAGNPYIARNTITCTEATEEILVLSAGVNADPHFGGNTIIAGTAKWTTGILIWSNTANILMEENVIFGGTSTISSVGIECTNSQVRICNNMIHGGTGPATSGIDLSNCTVNGVQSNTVNGGSGENLSAAISLHGCSPEIVNNILFTSGTAGQAGIQEHDEYADTAELRNCLFYDYLGRVHDPDTQELMPYVVYGEPILWTAEDMETHFGAHCSGVVLGNPFFADIDGPDDDINTMDDNDWHLSASTPPSVYEGGYDLSDEYTTDRDGTERTAPWSIGAYEYDGP